MPTPTFTSSYVDPGPYVQIQNASLPSIPSSGRVSGIAGQGSKTLPRSQSLVKGAANGQDGPLTNNTVINITQVQDINNVIYRQGIDYQLTRTNGGANAVVDWSLMASLTGTVNLTTLTYPTQLDGKAFIITVNGVTQSIVFSAPANAAAVVSQINSWVGSTIASLNSGNFLVLTADSLAIETSPGTTILGFVNGQAAATQQPAPGVSYTVQYVSDKMSTEYAATAFEDINSLLAYYGPLNPFIAAYSGTAASATTNTLTGAGTPGWTLNAFAGWYIKITGGTGTGQVRVIISNTANVLTLSQPWTQYNQPDTTSTFSISQYNHNGISRGAWAQYQLGTTQWVGSQYADDIFDSSNMKPAIDGLGQIIQGLSPEAIVLMHGVNASTEQGIIAYLQNRVDTDWGVLAQGKVKQVVVGLAYGTDTPLTYQTLAQATQDGKVYIVGLSECPIDFGVGAGVEQLDGSYWAALVAGAYCDYKQTAANTLKNYNLSSVVSVDSFTTPFTSTETTLIAGSGILTIVRDGINIVIQNDLSTDQTTDLDAYLSYYRRMCAIVKNTLSFLGATFKGQTLVQSPDGTIPLLIQAETGLSHVYDQMTNVNAQIIFTFSGVSIDQDGDVLEQVDVSANIQITPDVVWEFANLTLSVG